MFFDRLKTLRQSFAPFFQTLVHKHVLVFLFLVLAALEDGLFDLQLEFCDYLLIRTDLILVLLDLALELLYCFLLLIA